MSPPPLLVVNADDYGLTRATSEAILTAHQEGIVTSTSVLVLAPGFRPTAPWLVDQASLGVGVHLAFVGEDPPLLSASEIPTLVDRRTGHLASSWRSLLPRLVARRVDPGDLAREAVAQIEAGTSAGLTLDHLDTHQHLHLWPAVRDVVLDLAAEKGIGSVRTPWSTRRGAQGAGLRRLAMRLRSAAYDRGLVTSDLSAGLDEAGRFHAERLTATIDRLAAATGRTTPSGPVVVAELGCHPGPEVDPDRDRYRWGYHWADELAALSAPLARAAIDRAGFALTRWPGRSLT